MSVKIVLCRDWFLAVTNLISAHVCFIVPNNTQETNVTRNLTDSLLLWDCAQFQSHCHLFPRSYLGHRFAQVSHYKDNIFKRVHLKYSCKLFFDSSIRWVKKLKNWKWELIQKVWEKKANQSFEFIWIQIFLEYLESGCWGRC